MKVLRIRGQNLNALERFEVDLTEAPLVDAGLFAITGETGAGKTTLLDALTLALYGDYPRVAEAGGGLVPDPSGERISGGDPRSILRRGTGAGFAEVDFVGIDGEGYRVRWSVARARGRVDGNPQKVGRGLYRLSDDGAVAQGKTEVSERIQALTGLDFGQFRRTALLAQGEFDAFLMASENDRATLLQRITDTGIYSRLSTQVHQGTQERRNKAAEMRQRLDLIGLLPSEERAALEAELTSLHDVVAGLKQERTVLAPAIEGAMRVARAQEAVDKAVEAQAAAAGAMDAAAVDRARLNRFDAVHSIHGLLVERRRTQGEGIRTAAARESADEERVRLEAAVQDASRLFAEKERLAAECDRTVEASIPVWAEAARLDLELAGAERDRRSAVATAEKATQEAVKAAQNVEAKKAELAGIMERRNKAQGRLTATLCHDILADDAARIESLFLAYDEASTQENFESARLADLRFEAGTTTSEVETASAARQSLLDERDQVDRMLNHLRTARIALDLDACNARKAALDSLGVLLSDHNRDHRRYDLAATRFRTADLERAEAVARGALAEKRQAEVETILRDKQGQRLGLGMAVERASGAASAAAASLRAVLAEGEPCPVCGSREHRPAASSDLERLAKQLRDDMETLGREIHDQSQAVVTAATEVTTARVKADDAERRMTEAEHEMAEAHEGFVARNHVLTLALSDCGIDERLPALDTAWSQEVWLPMSDRMGAARAPVLHGLAQGDRLSGEIDSASQRRDGIVTRIEALSTEITTASGRAQEVALRIAAAEARRDAAMRAMADKGRKLAPYMAAAGAPAERLIKAPSESAEVVAALGKERVAVRREAAELEVETGSATLTLGNAEEAARDARETDREAGVAASAATGVHSGWLDRRAELLDGEDVATHRTRTETAARGGRDAAAAARMALALAVSNAGAAAERHADAIAAADMAEGAAAAAAQAMVEGCLRLGHDEADAVALLDTPREEVDALRARVTALAQAVRDAEGLVTARRGDLDRVVAETAGVELPEDAPGRLVVLDAMIDGHMRSRGAMEGQVRADDERRVLAENLERGLAAANADLTVWAEVDDAIGSSSGDRFARLAQEITLEALVSLANEQLALVAPRYRLARGDGLSLHVADQDMGGDLRASRSLSGGERFLVSLGLALALSGLEGRQGHADVLFIDEGFGSLDAASLDVAIEALETLQAFGRKVAVVTHVAAMIERIPTQVRVTKRGGGRSVVEVPTF